MTRGARYVGAVDQGTTSTRFMIFDHGGNEIARHQLEHEQILPQPGWVEHDPLEITARTDEVSEAASASPLTAILMFRHKPPTGLARPASAVSEYGA